MWLGVSQTTIQARTDCIGSFIAKRICIFHGEKEDVALPGD